MMNKQPELTKTLSKASNPETKCIACDIIFIVVCICALVWGGSEQLSIPNYDTLFQSEPDHYWLTAPRVEAQRIDEATYLTSDRPRLDREA
jgi:hypothetical protein